MRLINIKAFFEREQVMNNGGRVNRRTKVLEFADDETTKYAILSHRWIEPTEVDYEEMVDLAKMEREESDEIRQRPGYKKILASCEQAKEDGYNWLWVDTCCIDKRSSAELSEAINSMYRWYENSTVCYAYLHDVVGSSFPTASDHNMYPNFNGWPEWFSRGWTLQEMIAPSNVQFFNKDWQPIGDKRTLSSILEKITRVPHHILTDGFSSYRPCVAQLISWAADRTTTRVEDRAYSLMGLLDVNMPMLYGEGKKAFHRLQVEIIRSSNDQSIFAWDCHGGGRPGSILADDPSFFKGCDEMKLMDLDEFIQYLENDIAEEELPSMDDDRFGVFPITNRGIQIWMLLRPYSGSRSVFQAWLPCRSRPSGPPVTINLASWNYNYYRYFSSLRYVEPTVQFRQVYLRYQDTHPDVTFEFDDSAIIENGFTCLNMDPSELMGNVLTLTAASSLCVRVYSDRHARFAVAFGQYFGQDWMHCICAPSASGFSWHDEQDLLVRGPEHAQSMADAPSRGERYGRVWVKDTCLPQSTWIVRTSRVVWERSKIGVRMEVFRRPHFRNRRNEWRALDVEGINDPSRDMRGLMLRAMPCKPGPILCVDGVWLNVYLTLEGAKLGDYGDFTDFGSFRRKGNIFADIKSLTPEVVITPRQHKVIPSFYCGRLAVTPHTVGLSLPGSHAFNSLLASLSPQLINAYLVTMVVQCAPESSGSDTTNSIPACFCTITKPLIWYRDEDTGSRSPG